MTPKLSEDQRQAIERTGGTPVEVLDPATNTHYVLLRADQYDRVRTLLGDEAEIDPREAYPLVEEAFREGWKDPAMDAYDDYDAHRKL